MMKNHDLAINEYGSVFEALNFRRNIIEVILIKLVLSNIFWGKYDWCIY